MHKYNTYDLYTLLKNENENIIFFIYFIHALKYKFIKNNFYFCVFKISMV